MKKEADTSKAAPRTTEDGEGRTPARQRNSVGDSGGRSLGLQSTGTKVSGAARRQRPNAQGRMKRKGEIKSTGPKKNPERTKERERAVGIGQR